MRGGPGGSHQEPSRYCNGRTSQQVMLEYQELLPNLQAALIEKFQPSVAATNVSNLRYDPLASSQTTRVLILSESRSLYNSLFDFPEKAKCRCWKHCAAYPPHLLMALHGYWLGPDSHKCFPTGSLACCCQSSAAA